MPIYSQSWYICSFHPFYTFCKLSMIEVNKKKKKYYLAHPARRSLTRVWVLMSKLSSITWSHSHLVRAPFTLLASSAAKEGWGGGKVHASETISSNLSQLKVCLVKLVHLSHTRSEHGRKTVVEEVSGFLIHGSVNWTVSC